MRFAILGPLEVRDSDGRPVDIAGGRLRSLLTRLALDAGRPVVIGDLVETVWGDRPPADAANALQTLVSRLRRALGDPGAITASAAGYRLAAGADDVDAHRFTALAAAGSAALRAGDRADAARVLAEALDLWRGPALADVGGPTVEAQAARLDQLHLAVQVERIDADLGTGDAAGLVAEVAELTDAYPLDERVAALTIRTLAGAGRQAEALQAYEAVRARLADELGVDPSQALQDVHLAALRGELGAAPVEPAPSRRTNLRAQLTSFVGRDDEVARIAKSLDQSRLVTLVGPGGAGKTRLAAEAAGRMVDCSPDGVWFVELAPVTAGNDVASAVLSSLGLRDVNLREVRAPAAGRDAPQRLLDGLADRRTVLVLDNCEHLIDACAQLTDLLLAHCPDLRVLATSREPLGIVGEVLLAVPPLHQPDATASAEEAMQYPAVRLFVDRAAAVRPDFTIDDADAPAVIEIVRRLDGLPLAIELAAARLRTLPVDEIARRLDQRFRLLTGGSRTALPRHRTLRAVVEWSWELLDDDEQALAEQLCVFAAGVTEDSAAAVCEIDSDEVPDLLASLVDKSLLQPVDGGRRLRMLETIREFGADRLAERGALGELRARHAAYFATMVGEAGPHLVTAGQVPYFRQLDAERENILAALRYYVDTGEADSAQRLVLDLGLYAMMIGENSELGLWLEEALAVPGGTEGDVRILVEALHAVNFPSPQLGVAQGNEDDHEARMAELAARVAEVDVDTWPFAPLLRAVLAFFGHDADLVHKFTTVAADAPDNWTTAAMSLMRGAYAENEGDTVELRLAAGDALTRFRKLGERWGLAGALRMTAHLHTMDGDLEGARAMYEEARSLAAALNSRDDEGFVLGQLADLELRRGDIAAAREYIVQSRAAAEETGEAMEMAFALAMLAAVEEAAGDVDEARRLNRESEARMRELPARHPAMGHIRALSLSVSARLAANDDDLAQARRMAVDAYTAAVGTHDLPILAGVGVSVAHVAAQQGNFIEAAEILGASATLRGGDDPTSPFIASLTQRLRAAVGEQALQAAYAKGKALDRASATERLNPSVSG